MFTRFAASLALFTFSAAALLAAEPVDRNVFVAQLREPQKIEIAARALEAVPFKANIHVMDFSPDVSTLFAVHTNSVMVTWDVATGKIKSTNKVSGKKVRAQVGEATDSFVEIYAFSRDRKRLAMALRSGDVVFWDIEKEEVVSQMDASLKGKCSSMVLSSDGKYALIGGAAERGAVVIDTATGKSVFVHNAAKTPIQAVAISADDKWAMFFEQDRSHRYPLLGGQGGVIDFKDEVRISAFKAVGEHAMAITNANVLLRFDSEGSGVYTMRAGFPAKLVASADGRYFVMYDGQANLELRASETAAIGWHHRFEEEKATAFAVGSDGRTLALNTKDGPVLRLLSQTPEHPIARAHRLLRERLEAKDYEALKAIARQLNKEHGEPFAWLPQSPPFDILFSFFANRRSAPALEKWLEVEKEALVPKLLLADLYIKEAWGHRGGGSALTVTDAGWKGFYENIDKAQALLEPICAQPNAPAPARSKLLTVAMARSWDEAKWMPQADLVLKNAPEYVTAHAQVVQMQLPRWGGKPGDSAKYAARVADTIGGLEGDAIYARIWLLTYDLHGQQDKLVTELAMDADRVQRGLLHLAEKSANPAYYGHRGLRLAKYRGDKTAAQGFLAKLKDPMENWESGWWLRAADLQAAIKFASP